MILTLKETLQVQTGKLITEIGKLEVFDYERTSATGHPQIFPQGTAALSFSLSNVNLSEALYILEGNLKAIETQCDKQRSQKDQLM